MEEIGNIREYLVAALLTLDAPLSKDEKIKETDKLLIECIEYIDNIKL